MRRSFIKEKGQRNVHVSELCIFMHILCNDMVIFGCLLRWKCWIFLEFLTLLLFVWSVRLVS